EVPQQLRGGFRSTLAPHPVDAARQIRKPACFGNGRPAQPDRLCRQDLPQDTRSDARETFLESGASWLDGLIGAGDFAHVTRHDCSEQRLLAREPGINRRLAGMRDVGDLVDAGTLDPAFEKYLLGRVEDPLLDLAGERPGRPTGSDNGAEPRTV